jgi:hypothetical protein
LISQVRLIAIFCSTRLLTSITSPAGNPGEVIFCSGPPGGIPSGYLAGVIIHAGMHGKMHGINALTLRFSEAFTGRIP